jgi:hypothetical protein
VKDRHATARDLACSKPVTWVEGDERGPFVRIRKPKRAPTRSKPANQRTMGETRCTLMGWLKSNWSGGELGWFDWDPASGRMSTLLEVDSNLTSGTSHGSEADPPISISDTAIGSTGFTIPRLPDEVGATPSSLVGLWAVNSPTDLSVAHLAFFANGRAMFLAQQADADCLGGSAPGECPPGVEYASYTWDPVTGSVVLTLLAGETTLPGGQRLLHYDTNGCQGLFDTCPRAVADGRETRTTTIVFTVAADGRTITFTGGDDLPYTLYRIATRGL